MENFKRDIMDNSIEEITELLENYYLEVHKNNESSISFFDSVFILQIIKDMKPSLKTADDIKEFFKNNYEKLTAIHNNNSYFKLHGLAISLISDNNKKLEEKHKLTVFFKEDYILYYEVNDGQYITSTSEQKKLAKQTLETSDLPVCFNTLNSMLKRIMIVDYIEKLEKDKNYSELQRFIG